MAEAAVKLSLPKKELLDVVHTAIRAEVREVLAAIDIPGVIRDAVEAAMAKAMREREQATPGTGAGASGASDSAAGS